MQYKVPQNVDIEDKVIAGLTLRQFMFLMVAGGIVLMLRYVFTGGLDFLFLPVALIVGGIGVAFAFVKINDRPFEIFATSALKSLLTPSKRVWSKDMEIETPHPEAAKKVVEIQKKKSLGEIKSNLEKLATVVDSGGAHDLAPDERITNLKAKETEEAPGLHDVLAATEQKPAELSKIMDQAKQYVDKNKKEETVGEIATVQTKKEDFKYDQISLADEKKLEEALQKSEADQQKLEEELATAKIKKFDHQD